MRTTHELVFQILSQVVGRENFPFFPLCRTIEYRALSTAVSHSPTRGYTCILYAKRQHHTSPSFVSKLEAYPYIVATWSACTEHLCTVAFLRTTANESHKMCTPHNGFCSAFWVVSKNASSMIGLEPGTKLQTATGRQHMMPSLMITRHAYLIWLWAYATLQGLGSHPNLENAIRFDMCSTVHPPCGNRFSWKLHRRRPLMTSGPSLAIESLHIAFEAVIALDFAHVFNSVPIRAGNRIARDER